MPTSTKPRHQRRPLLATCTWRGHRLTFVADSRDHPTAEELRQEGRNIAFVHALLGPVQWAAVEPDIVTVGDVKDLMATMKNARDAATVASRRDRGSVN